MKLRNLQLFWVLLQVRRYLVPENIFYWLRYRQEMLAFGFCLCSAKMVSGNRTREVTLKQK